MRILITGGRSPLGSALAQALAGTHEVLTLDLPDTRDTVSLTYSGDLRDRECAVEAQDCDAIVHLLPQSVPGSNAQDILDRATRGTYNLATTTSATRFILLSSLRVLERYPSCMLVTEDWAPRPSTDVADLAPYLAEVVLREASRVLSIKAIALRLGEVLGPDEAESGVANSRAVHREDVVQAVERALAFEPASDGPRTGWWVFHITGAGARTRFPLGRAGQAPFGYQPHYDVAGDAPQVKLASCAHPTSMREHQGGAARKVVIFGAGGPLAAATSEVLAHDHMLRLADLRPLQELDAPSPHQRPDVPVSRVRGAPHEMCVVDITDSAQVLQAARGMDAIINCAVLRHDPVEAFRVNMLGAYNVMCAAVACGIRRVVHTGPYQVYLPYPAGYWYDNGIVDDVPARPGTALYILTKLLGQEICRIFAEEHDLEVPALLFCHFINPSSPPDEPLGLFPFSVSWSDAADAMRLALRAPSFPHPFEVVHILADLPHGKYSNEKAKRLLNWQPRDRLEQFYTRWLPGDG